MGQVAQERLRVRERRQEQGQLLLLLLPKGQGGRRDARQEERHLERPADVARRRRAQRRAGAEAQGRRAQDWRRGETREKVLRPLLSGSPSRDQEERPRSRRKTPK